MIIELTSADLAADSRLDDYTRLKDVKLRSKIEPERGLYMAESANVIERAIRAGHHPRSFLMSKRWLPTLEALISEATGAPDGAQVPVFVADEDVLEQMTGFHLHRGALAAMQRPILPSLDELLALQTAGFTVASLALSDDSVSLDDFASLPALQGPDARLAMVMGTEGDGLGRRTIAASDYTVKIPMDHGVDSLNVAAASAVVFWATRGIGTQQH